MIKEKAIDKNQPNILIKGITVDDWDKESIKLGKVSNWISTRNDSHKASSIYKLYLDSEETPIYIGKATDNGLFKRLFDYIREDSSSRNSKTGILINHYKDRLRIEGIILGSEPHDIGYAVALEVFLIMKYKPRWNNEYNRKNNSFTDEETKIIKKMKVKQQKEKEK